MNDRITKLVREALPWIIQQRRYFHQYPELRRKEFRTSERIQQELSDLGIAMKTGYYNTGVVGIIEGENEGPVIGLRFDMDALEVQELNEVSYKSIFPGVMHACGHDGHIAMGLGTARVLSLMKDKIHGKVKLIFQPAEEDAPHGGGAQHMIREGVLEEPAVDFMMGMHIWPELPLGKIGAKPGVMMAASDPFVIDIHGKGAHASMPYLGIDPIMIGVQIMNGIQTIVSRSVDPFEQAVISVGVFQGGSRYNIIPETVRLEGTVRTFNQEVRMQVYEKMKDIVTYTAKSLGGSSMLDYRFTYPPLMNDEKLLTSLQKIIENVFGKNAYEQIQRPAPGGEDFAYFAQILPSVFLFLGSGEESKTNFPLHNGHFDFNESVLEIGTKVFASSAIALGRNFYDAND